MPLFDFELILVMLRLNSKMFCNGPDMNGFEHEMTFSALGCSSDGDEILC